MIATRTEPADPTHVIANVAPKRRARNSVQARDSRQNIRYQSPNGCVCLTRPPRAEHVYRTTLRYPLSASTAVSRSDSVIQGPGTSVPKGPDMVQSKLVSTYRPSRVGNGSLSRDLSDCSMIA